MSFEPQRPPDRHGCLAAYLVIIIVLNALVALLYLLTSDAITDTLEDAGSEVASWTIPALGILAILNVVFAIAIWRWQRWGFWGLVASAVVAFAVNLSIGVSLPQALLGLVGLAVLAGVLQMGGPSNRTGWAQLR